MAAPAVLRPVTGSGAYPAHSIPARATLSLTGDPRVSASISTRRDEVPDERGVQLPLGVHAAGFRAGQAPRVASAGLAGAP